MLDALTTTEGISTLTTAPSIAPTTSLLVESSNSQKGLMMDIDDGEELFVLEPTDPDEDRLREAALQAQHETEVIAVQTVSEPLPHPPPVSPPEPLAPDKNAVTTDPVLLSQIIQALSTRPGRQILENVQQSPRFLVTSSNNVLTLQPTPVPIPPQTSFMVQPLSGLQAARLLNLTSVSPPPPPPPSTPISNAGLQSLLSTDPLLYGIFVNCATSNMITQLANSISASMLSFAQLVAIDKNINLNHQIGEITQLISALVNLATSLSTTLPGLMSLRGSANPKPSTSTPQTNPILTSLIAVSSSASSTSQPINPPVSPLADNSNSVGVPQPPNLANAHSCAPIHVKSEQSTLISGRDSPPIAGLVTRSGTVLTSVKTVPRPKRFSCTHSGCTRAFSSKFNLVEHIRIHTGERPFVCPEPGCSWRFKRRRDLYEHSIMHKKFVSTPGKALLVTSVLPETENGTEDCLRSRHFCSFPNCQRSYARRHRLNQHMCCHTGVGPFYCDQPKCNVRYFNSHDLERHKLVHALPSSSDPARKHICPHENCGKAFPKLNKLREHVRSHTGERPFVCQRKGCGAAFSRPYGLKRHQLTHATITHVAPPNIPRTSPSSPNSATFVASSPTNRNATAVFPQTSTLINVASSIAQPAIFNLVQALTSGVQLQPAVTTTSNEETSQVPLSVMIKADPDSTPVSAVTSPPPPPNFTITSVASTSANKLPLVQRSSKAAATPSASALAEKAIVVSGPFGKRRHICPMSGCTKIFPKLNKLREHICRHTGERPYACDECPATFVRMYDLRRHALIHTRRRMGILNNTNGL